MSTTTTAANEAVPEGPVIPRRERPRRGHAVLALLAAPGGWVALFFLVPVLMVAAYSVGALTLLPRDLYLSLRPWQDFFASETHTGLFWKSVRLSTTVSIVSVLLAYPVAYVLALVAGRRKYTLLLLIIAPFLTSYLLRVLAWRVILGAEGVVNSALFTLGLRADGDPVSWLIYSQFTVILVLAYVWLPFVALPIFVSLENLDRSLLEAANDLGARRWLVFWRVTFPLSLPGIAAAFVFVFIPTIGEFVTPSLVGGRSGLMYGNAISELFLQGLDWETGSVLALFLVAVVGLLLAASSRFLRPSGVAS